MNHAVHTFGDATSVKERYGSENAVVRPEKLMDVLCYNASGAELYLQVHEITPGTAAAPADGSVPKFSFPVQNDQGGTLGRAADMQGIYCCWSSTALTKTIVLANSGSINIIVKA